MMDRRTFNKGVGAFFGALSLPFGFKSIPASVAKNPKIYYAANSVGISTTSDFSQRVFTTGSLEIYVQNFISVYENIEGKPDVDVDVSFWLNKDHTIERKIYFKGNNITWSKSTSVISYKNGFGSFKTFEPGTENRVPLNELSLDVFYDIVVTYEYRDSSDYILTLENFQVTKIEDFNADENDI